MVRVRHKELLTMKIPVSTLQRDIEDGKCGLPHHCMEMLAVTRALIEQLSLNADRLHRLHVKVDAGHIKFNYAGYRWIADTPTKARNALIDWDSPGGKDRVKPHRYTIIARRSAKIIKLTDERREQINMARQERIRQGRPDKEYRDPSIHSRVVGYTKEVRGRRKQEEDA